MPVAALTTSLEDFAGAPALVGYGGGQGAAVNNDVIIEGEQSAGRRVDNATNKGFGASFGAVNLSAVGQHIKVWLFVTQWAEVSQVQVRISSGADDDHELNPAEYPRLGGFIPVWVDVSRVPEVGGGANEAAIGEVGVMLDIGDVGGNAPNLILDEITHGTRGLEWTGAGGSVTDLLAFEDVNAEGVIVEFPSGVAMYFAVNIGDGATATTFTHGQKLTVPDQGLVADGAVEWLVDLNNAADSFTGANGGGIESKDPIAAGNRPHFRVVGTAGSATLQSGYQLVGMGLITWTAGVSVTGGTYDTVSMVQGGAGISDAVIRTRSASGVSCLTDADISLMTGVQFVQVGSGHAIEITTPGQYNIDQLRGLNAAGGYGPDGALDAGIYNNSGSLVELIRLDAGTPTPTVRNGAGATTDIPAVQIALSITGIPAGLEARYRQGSHTLVYFPNAAGTVSYTYSYEGADRPVTISIGGVANDGTAYERREIELFLTDESQSIPFSVILNPSYSSL